MLGKSASVSSLPKRYQQSTEIISSYPAPLGLSQYQKRMKKFYDDLNQRAYENTKKDREVVDYLNDWRYCDPDNRVDELPEPYRGINEIIQDDIMNQVWVNISKVEIARKDPSYDANLPKLQPSGEVSSSQIKGICAIAEAQDNPKKHLFLGDSFGNIFIFDQSKKQVVSKFDSLPDKRRILSISAQIVKIQGSNIVTLAVIQHGSAHVSILRYIVGGENILLKQFKISTTALAFSVELSPKATFCSLSHYNGNVTVYRVPEPPLQKMMDLNDEDDHTTNTVHSGTSRFSNKQTPMRGSPRLNEYELPEKKPDQVEELTMHHSIEFKGIKRERKYENVLKDIQKQNDTLKASLLGVSLEEFLAIGNPPPVPEAATAAAPAKKDTKKAGKANEPVKPAEVVQAVEAIPSILRNAELTQSQLTSQPVLDAVEGDITPAIPFPQYCPRIFFQSEKVSMQNKDRLFKKPYLTSITTTIFVAWMNTKSIEYHRLVEPIWANVPAFIQYVHTRIMANEDNKKNDEKASSNPVQLSSPPANTFVPKLVSESQMIYPISSQINWIIP